MTPAPAMLRVERVLAAPPERVFDAWTDPEVLRRWWAAQPDWTTPEASADVRVGGRYRLAMSETGTAAIHTVVGEYLEVDRPHRLVYTWAWESESELSDGGSRTVVTVQFMRDGPGTRVIVEQRGFESDAERDGHRDGWSGCLDNLERRVIAAAGTT